MTKTNPDKELDDLQKRVALLKSQRSTSVIELKLAAALHDLIETLRKILK